MSSGNIQKSQTLIKPTFSEKEATELVERVFGLKVSAIGSLPSYDDQNFHVHISRSEGTANCADEYVLKITNCEDSQNSELIEVQTQIMMFLNVEGFPSATPHLTKDGNIMSLESLGINHGDLNDHNILLDSNTASPENPQYRVSGILDFSDMSYGYYVFELAITIMYMMIESTDPLSVGGHVLAGFESVVPLTTEERDTLFLLVSGRFSQSLVIASYTSLLYPENKEYLMITAKTGWKHLLRMFDVGQEAVEKIWFETAKAYMNNELV